MMLKTLKDPEGPWRLKWAATAIFYMQWWQKCVWLSVLNVWFFFTHPKMIGDDGTAAQGTQKVTLPSVWTATLSGALGLIAPLEQDEMQSNDIQWVWCFGLMLGFDMWVRVWYLLWTRRGAIQCGPPSHTQLVSRGPSTPASPGSVLLKWRQSLIIDPRSMIPSGIYKPFYKENRCYRMHHQECFLCKM